MEHKKVLKFLEIMGFIFMSVSVMEIAFFITLNFTEFENITGGPILLSEFIYGSSYISYLTTILWFFLIISIACYFVTGFFLRRTGKNNKIQSLSLAKLMVLLGMVILIGALVKLNYLVLLGRTKITTLLGPVSFQSAMYRFDISPLSSGIFWVYFIAANCSYLIAALVITATGIKWTTLMEQAKPKEQ
ncbi:MAG: hypothetical protein ACW986_06490 [Promethearchaeota archaeon]|jgi:hypothetical protein